MLPRTPLGPHGRGQVLCTASKSSTQPVFLSPRQRRLAAAQKWVHACTLQGCGMHPNITGRRFHRRWREQQEEAQRRQAPMLAPPSQPGLAPSTSSQAASTPQNSRPSPQHRRAQAPVPLPRPQNLQPAPDAASTSGRPAPPDASSDLFTWTRPGRRLRERLRAASSTTLARVALQWASQATRLSQDPTSSFAEAAQASVQLLADVAQERLQAAGTLGGSGTVATAFSQQELADLTCGLAHFLDPGPQLGEFEAAMGVPFRVIPNRVRGLDMQRLLAEIELHQDTIYLDNNSRPVLESRKTGWQSDIGATFCYSGKEMHGPPMTPEVAKVRDQLLALTGEHFDSVLINYYEDGRCGMRFHVDPLYGVWTPNTAVVSVGETRRFIFREQRDFSSRWEYSVRHGDTVFMHSDCQDRLQHSVKVERADKGAARLGPRLSLVFKQRIAAEGHGTG